MKLNPKIKLKELQQLAKVSDIVAIKCPVKFHNWITTVHDATWERFIIAAKYNHLTTASEFIAALNGLDAVEIGNMTTSETLGAFYQYSKEFAETLKLFEQQADLMPRTGGGQLYDMAEFGLTNYASFITNGSLIEYDHIMQKQVSYVFTEYRRKIKTIANQIKPEKS